MAGVMVELVYSRQRKGLSEFGCTLTAIEDSPDVQPGAVVRLDGDNTEWTVRSVYRCAERPDGTLDHSECFGCCEDDEDND